MVISRVAPVDWRRPKPNKLHQNITIIVDFRFRFAFFSKVTENQNASDMNKMVWDQDLADAAQEYVESCELGFLVE